MSFYNDEEPPRLGPNAVSALAVANMKTYLSEGATAADCVARYLSGEAGPGLTGGETTTGTNQLIGREKDRV